MNGTRRADSPGRVVSFGQVIVDLTIRVERVPQPGEDVYADRAGVAVGAGFNALYAVRRMGVDAVYAGALGTGPWADRIRAALEREGIAHGGVTDREDDNGFCIALTDADAERTFVSVRGAETRLGPHGFDNAAVGSGDVAILSGYTLIHRSAEALSAFMRRTAGHDFPAVFDTSPVIGQITDAQLGELVSYRPIWTCNEREGGILAERLGLGRTAPQTDNGGLCTALRDALHAPVVLRAGRGGAWVGSEDGTVEPVPGFPVTAVDTNGAGDCHTGVICAELCRGTDLVRAVRLANAAAAIAVIRHGPATCPTRGEAEALIARADEGRR